MDTKILIGIVAVIIALVGGYFFFFTGTTESVECSPGYSLKNGICVKDAITTPPDNIIPDLKGDFSEQYETMSETWQNLGLKEKTFHGNYEALKELPSSELLELENAMQTFENQTDSKEVKDLSEIYVQMINIAKRQQTLESSLATFQDSENVCDSLVELRDLSDNLSEIVERTKNLSNSIEAFNTIHPNTSEILNLNPVGSELGAAQLAVAENLAGFELLEEACAGA